MHTGTLQFVKYGLVGVVNTAVTFFSFVALIACGLGPDWANLSSYAAGIVCSFVLNRCWTFNAQNHSRRHTGRQAIWFAVGAALCWLVQWGVFRAVLPVAEPWMALAAGMVVYTVANFFFNKYITFK